MSEEIDVTPDAPTANEVEARKFGWVSKDEFKGDETQWRDADAFLARGKEINGFLRKDLEKLERAQKQELEQVNRSVEELKKFYQDSAKKAQVQYAREIAELRKQRATAITEGDGERVLEIEDEIANTQEAARDLTAEPVPNSNMTPPQNKEWTEWLSENQWYITNKDLKAAATDVGDLVKADHPEWVGKQFLNEVAKRLKELMPEEFENPARQASAVGSSSDGRSPAGKGKGKTYANLPPEAKKHCDDFVKRGWVTQDEYLKTYDWDGE